MSLVTADLTEVEHRVIAERTRLFGTTKIPVILALHAAGAFESRAKPRDRFTTATHVFRDVQRAKGAFSRTSVFNVVRLLTEDKLVERRVDDRIRLTVRGQLLANAILVGWSEDGLRPKHYDLISSRDAWSPVAARVLQSMYHDLLTLDI